MKWTHTIDIVVLKLAGYVLGFSLSATGELRNIKFVLVTIWSSEHFLHFRVQLHLVGISMAISLICGVEKKNKFNIYKMWRIFDAKLSCCVRMQYASRCLCVSAFQAATCVNVIIIIIMRTVWGVWFTSQRICYTFSFRASHTLYMRQQVDILIRSKQSEGFTTCRSSNFHHKHTPSSGSTLLSKFKSWS